MFDRIQHVLQVVSQSKVSIDEDALQIWEETATIHMASNNGGSLTSVLIRTNGECDIRMHCSQGEICACHSHHMNVT